MLKRQVYIVSMVVNLLLTITLFGQHISFYYLGPENGMQALASARCIIDGYGHFWVTTLDGVVRYNGNKFDFYNTITHPEMPTNDAGSLYRDSRNRVWFSSPKGLILFDEKRQISRVTVVPDETDRAMDVCYENSDGSITAVAGGKSFTSGSVGQPWQPQPWLDTLIGADVRDIKHVGRDQVLLIIPTKGLLLIDTRQHKEIISIPLRGVLTAEIIDQRFIYAATNKAFELVRIDLQHPEAAQVLPLPDFVEKGDDGSEIQYMAKATDGKLYMTTARNGLIQYDPQSDTYTHFNHDPIDPFSIMDDRLRYIYADEKGNLLIAGVTGLNYTNVGGSRVQYFNSLRTQEGEIIDERVNSLHEDGKGRLWFTTDHGLFRLSVADRVLHEVSLPVTSSLYTKTPFLTNVSFDGEAHIWASYHSDGIAIYDQEGNHVRDLHEAQYPGYTVALNQTRIMRKGMDRWMYIGTSEGLFRMDPVSFAIDTFPDDPALAPLRRARIVDILMLPDVIWVASSPSGAAWKYQFSTKTLSVFDVKAGLPSSRVYSIGVDKQGVALVGSYSGLTMIYPDGQIRNFQKGNGLPGTRIECIQEASDGSIWLTNSYNLLSYDERIKEVSIVVGEPHLSDVGFQIVSSAALSSGPVAFGVHKGLILVDPAIRHQRKPNFDVVVFYKNIKGHEILCTPDIPLRLSYKEQFLRFDIGITNLILANKMVYQYRIVKDGEGLWSEPSTVSQVNFNLQPGRYKLDVRAFNGSTWVDAPGPIAIQIKFPWWQRWWFMVIALSGLLAAVIFFLRARMVKYKRDLTITRQIGELESKALRSQMNPHFVFNSLNAIQECIVTKKFDEAYSYLSKFSRLLRLVLEHSDKPDLSLQEELEVLNLYVSLEKLRFQDQMEIHFDIDTRLDPEEILIPPMLIQPHLENAIWHGLRYKEGKKLLTVSLAEDQRGYLEVVIVDNGIGRDQAAKLQKSKLGQHRHESRGSKLSGKRMELLQFQYPGTQMRIEDLVDEAGNAAGTRVLLTIPILDTTSEGHKLINA